MNFSIILVVHDRYDVFTKHRALSDTISSLNLLDGDFELVVVNNHDPKQCPKTSQYLKELAAERPSTKLIETGGNLGCGGGFNRGAAKCSEKSSVFVYMSPDAAIQDRFTLKKIELSFEKNPRIGMVHPVSIYEDMDEYNFSKKYYASVFYRLANFSDGMSSGEHPLNSPEEIESINSIISQNRFKVEYPLWAVPLTFLSIRRSLYEQLSGFDENFFAGGENIDIVLRALQMGYYAARLNNVFVYHRRLLFKHLGSGGRNRELDLQGAERHKHYWKKKWGKEPIDIYNEIRYGKSLFRWIIKPSLIIQGKLRHTIKQVMGKG